jgi:hypothetical protein
LPRYFPRVFALVGDSTMTKHSGIEVFNESLTS